VKSVISHSLVGSFSFDAQSIVSKMMGLIAAPKTISAPKDAGGPMSDCVADEGGI
jgi:hypothetical protein